ncbi:MAG: Ig-like domain-containing protein, partial [Nitrosomonas sp.]
MIFILNENGVPSVAKFVKIGIGSKPVVSVTSPGNDITIAGSSVKISANAIDDIGVSGVQFKLDGANLGAEDTTPPYAITWNSTVVADGTYTITAVARDADGNTTTSAGVSVTVNNTTLLPDVIVTELFYADGIFTSTVMNQGTAATPAGKVIGVGYSVNGNFKTWGDVAGPLAAGASVTIGTKGGSYNIPNGIHTMTADVDDVNRFEELDETNNQLSKPVTGDTIDTIAPTVSISTPTGGSTVAGSSVTISASASDNFGVLGVEFSITGAYPLPEVTTAPYTIIWDSTAVTDGPRTITAVARDAAGNTTTSTAVSITVANGAVTSPTVSITAPSGGSTVTGSSVMISANAADDISVSGVQFMLDGANLGAEVTTPPYAVTWDSTAVADGPHIITAVARDADGNTATSAGVSVTVANTMLLPDVIVTSVSYADGIFTSTVTNQGTAATPVGTAIGVGYSVNGNFRTWGAVAGPLAIGASVTIGTNGGPYIIPNGTHTIMADVDDVNRFTESNETNNQLSQPVIVDGG